jgi:hypothetical protein
MSAGRLPRKISAACAPFAGRLSPEGKELAMLRPRLLGCLVMAAGFVCFHAAPVGAAEPDITGKYNCEGSNPGGKMYRGIVEITKKGDTYLVRWNLSGGDSYQGVGLLEGKTLAVSFNAGVIGLAVYRVEKGGKLVGRWTIGNGKGKVYTEKLTKN